MYDTVSISFGSNDILQSVTDNFSLENEPKLEETTVNDLELRYHSSIEGP